MKFDVNTPKYLSLAERIESYKQMAKELKVYKKALELACEDLSTVKRCAIRQCVTKTAICLEYDTCHDNEKLADKYLQQAREEE